jgi:hypothetical protein
VVPTSRKGREKWGTRFDWGIGEVKGNGQEYPLHNCNIKNNINVKNSGEGVCGSHLSVGAIAGVKSLRLFPDLKGRNARWEGYREAWAVVSG